MTLYRTALGTDFAELPAPLRAFHAGEHPTRWQGRATVTRGAHPLARALATLFGFPQTGADQPADVTVTPNGITEHWARRIGPSHYHSTQTPGRHPGQIIEGFGPLRFTLALSIKDNALHLKPIGWTALGLPLPTALLPSGPAFEHGAKNRFNFDITIRAPLVGLIVAYAGWLEPAEMP